MSRNCVAALTVRLQIHFCSIRYYSWAKLQMSTVYQFNDASRKTFFHSCFVLQHPLTIFKTETKWLQCFTLPHFKAEMFYWGFEVMERTSLRRTLFCLHKENSSCSEKAKPSCPTYLLGPEQKVN